MRLIGDLPEPPVSHFIEMLQRSERATVEQIRLHVEERTFDFAFGLGAADLASPRPETIVRGERQKACVVNRLIVFPTRDDHFHVVVQACRGDALEMIERPDVLADRRVEVLSLRKADILSPGITQQITEQIDFSATFLREVDLIGGPVHLGLNARTGLEANREWLGRLPAKFADAIANERVLAWIALLFQLFEQPRGGNAWISAGTVCEVVKFVSAEASPSVRSPSEQTIIVVVCSRWAWWAPTDAVCWQRMSARWTFSDAITSDGKRSTRISPKRRSDVPEAWSGEVKSD